MKKKVLVLYDYNLHYRNDLFAELANKYDLNVYHAGKNVSQPSDKYKEHVTVKTKLFAFYYHSKLVSHLINNNYNSIIVQFDLRWMPSLLAVLAFKKEAPIILWGAWETKNKIANYVRIYVTKYFAKSVFYSPSSYKYYRDKGAPESRLYIANNSVKVQINKSDYSSEKRHKDIFLFIGSFDKRKHLDKLILAFHEFVQHSGSNTTRLVLIGDGAEMQNIKRLLDDFVDPLPVDLMGRITDTNELSSFYDRAIASVSFGQAGLSVLQSIGHGVPFITCNNAISGGEIDNIINNINGLVCEPSVSSFASCLSRVYIDLEFRQLLSDNSLKHYLKYCTIENMASGFIDAIEGTRTAVTFDPEKYEV